MIWLVGGVLLWTLAHLCKRVTPGLRAWLQDSLGDVSKLVFALAILASVALMVVGYRSADFIPVWTPPAFFGHLNNLLMVVALYVYLSAMAAPRLWIARIKHPQLAGFKIWAVAHLLANGDLASIVLFGGLLGWAVVNLIVINRQSGPWDRPETAPIKSEVVMGLVGIAGFGVVSALHVWLGVNPFGGI
ncbi:MAG: NnrU family protein [Pseudomonadota bacterium]